MIVLLIILGFVATGLSIWLAALTSPTGYQNEAGFHFGVEAQLPLPKSKKGIATPVHSKSKVSLRGKKEGKTKSRPPSTSEWTTPNATVDQMKFPFPVAR